MFNQNFNTQPNPHSQDYITKENISPEQYNPYAQKSQNSQDLNLSQNSLPRNPLGNSQNNAYQGSPQNYQQSYNETPNMPNQFMSNGAQQIYPPTGQANFPNENFDEGLGVKSTPDFVEYDNLPAYPEGVDVNQITTEILNNFKSEDWKQKFASINNLRIINKYYPNDSDQIFQLFWEQILVSLDTKLTYIERTILNLFREAFAFKREKSFHDKILCDVIPKLLNKSVHHHHKFCKDLATETLGYIVHNYVNDAVIENVSGLVVRYSKEKDFPASDEALKYLSTIIQDLGADLK